MERRTFSAFSGEMQKTAVGPILGLFGHFGTNLAGRAAHKSSNLAEVMAHRGFQHGATGSRISRGADRAMRLLLGPESLVQYDAARAAGEKMYNLPPKQREAALQALSSGAQELASRGVLRANAPKVLGEAPVIGALQQAARHDVLGSTPKLKSKGLLAGVYGKAVDLMSRSRETPFQTPTQKVVSNVVGASPAAALAAADPWGAATHMGWNLARETGAKTQLGKEITKNQLRKGLAGVKPGKWEELASDIVASPAFLDPQRIGSALREAGAVELAQKAITAADDPLAQAFTRGMAGHVGQDAATQAAANVAKKMPTILERAKDIVPRGKGFRKVVETTGEMAG